MPKKPAQTVDGYIRKFPPTIQVSLKKFRRLIKKAAPQAEEKISYQMPGYYLHGYLVYFAAWKKHFGFYPASATALSAFKKDLTPYVVSKGTVQFPLNQPIPWSLIGQIVKYRVKENMLKKAPLKVCSRGHKFNKSTTAPVCPKCWPGYYHK